MKESLKIFTNSDFGEVRSLENNGKILFCGSDVARALGYSIPSKAIKTHCKGVSKIEVPTNGGKQEMIFITEGDVYRLIMRSKLESAEKFERWVCDEVIPQIRLTGGYIPVKQVDDDITVLSKAAVILQRTLELKVAQLQKLKPKVEMYEKLMASDNYFDMNTVAKSLDLGRNRMMQTLRDKKILYKEGKNTMPYQKYCNQGLFKINYGIGRNGQVYGVTKASIKGINYIYKLYNDNKALTEDVK